MTNANTILVRIMTSMNIRHIVSLVCISALIVLQTGCKKEIEKASWDVDVLAPLMRAELSFGDLVTDSMLTTNSNDLLMLVFAEDFYSFAIDTAFAIPDTSIEYTASLNNIDLNDISIEYRTSLGDIALKDLEDNGPSGGLYEIIMTAHNTGQPTTIDPISEQVFSNIDMDGTNYFQTIAVNNGFIDIKIDNKLPMAISDLIFEVRNQSDLQIILQDTFALIPSNTVATSTHSIAGLTIEGLLIGNVKIASPGAMVPVAIDTSDAMTATMTVRDLSISSATAVFSNQKVVDLNETAVFNMEDIQISEVIAKEGSISIKVYNTIEEELNYSYTVPGATLNGAPLELAGVIPASTGGNASFTVINQDISGYRILFTGIGPAEQLEGDLNGNGYIDSDTVNSIYYRATGGIDSTGNLVNLTMNDSLYILTEFTGFVPEYIKGYLGNQLVDIAGTADFPVIEGLGDKNILFDDVRLKINISNMLGLESDITFNNLTARNSHDNTFEDLVFPASQNPVHIEKPIDPQSVNTATTPTISTVDINSNNSNIHDLVNLYPDKLDYNLSLETNSGIPAPTPASGTDFLYFGDKVTASIELEVPLSVSVNNLRLIDTAIVNFSADNLEDINFGNLNIIFDNYFPLEATVQLYQLDSSYNAFDSLLIEPGIIEPGIPDQTDKVTSPRRSKISIPIDSDKIDQLSQTYFIKIVMVFNSKPDNTSVRIYNSYITRFTITADFNYHIGNE